MAHYNTIIRNGLVVDGTASPAAYVDVGISEGRIAAVGNLTADTADEEIDAAGKIVAPGHVTQHAHHDVQLFWDPYCSNSGEHGVTTIMNANCGFSIAPVRAADRERTMLMLSTTEQIPVAQQRAGLSWDWESFPEYLVKLRALPKGVNIMTYLPLNPLLIYVMGLEGAKTRRPTKGEIAEMHRLINEAMDLGAAGLSMSVMGVEGNSHVDFDGSSMPSDAMHDDDVVDIARAVAERGEGIIQMLAQITSNGNRGLTEKVARMAKGSGARVLHNAFIPLDPLAQMTADDIAWLEGLRAEGLDIVAGALLNRGWVEAGIRQLDTAAGEMAGVREIIGCADDEAVIALLSDLTFVRRFSDEYAKNGPNGGAGGFETQTIIDVGGVPELEAFVGRELGDISAETGQTVVEVLCELGVKSKIKIQFKSGLWAASDPALATSLLRNAGVSAGVSDGGAHTKVFANGQYGTELLIWLVREQKAFSLEDMHFQLSLKPAQTIQLRDRGALAPGFWADVLIYDLSSLFYDRSRYSIVHDMPMGDWRRNAVAGGYDRIMVNGITTHLAGASTGAVPGQFLRVTTNMKTTLAMAAE